MADQYGTMRRWDGVIVARQGAVSGTPPEGDPAVITYTAVAVNTTDQVRLTNHLPTRRISRGAKILVAEPGDPCVIHFFNNAFYLFPLTEGIPFSEACP